MIHKWLFIQNDKHKTIKIMVNTRNHTYNHVEFSRPTHKDIVTYPPTRIYKHIHSLPKIEIHSNFPISKLRQCEEESARPIFLF